MSCSRRGKEAEYIFKIQRLYVGSKAESNKKRMFLGWIFMQQGLLTLIIYTFQPNRFSWSQMVLSLKADIISPGVRMYTCCAWQCVHRSSDYNWYFNAALFGYQQGQDQLKYNKYFTLKWRKTKGSLHHTGDGMIWYNHLDLMSLFSGGARKTIRYFTKDLSLC